MCLVHGTVSRPPNSLFLLFISHFSKIISFSTPILLHLGQEDQDERLPSDKGLQQEHYFLEKNMLVITLRESKGHQEKMSILLCNNGPAQNDSGTEQSRSRRIKCLIMQECFLHAHCIHGQNLGSTQVYRSENRLTQHHFIMKHNGVLKITMYIHKGK